MGIDEESEIIVSALVETIAANTTTEEVKPAERAVAVEDFLETVGRLLAVVAGGFTPGRAAALLFVVESLGLDRMGEVDAKVTALLVEGMKAVNANLREARNAAMADAKAAEPPKAH